MSGYETFGAVVVGGGHNGLAAAILLAEAGWSVVVLERNETCGGAIRTEEVTLPGFRHDLMATNLNLFAGSAFLAEHGDGLRRHGLELVTATHPVCSLFPGGGHVGISTDLEETVAAIEAVSEADGRAFRSLFAYFGRVAPHLFPLLGARLPSVGATVSLARGTRALGKEWPLELARLVLQSPREFVTEHFESPEVQALMATWGMHLDFPPDMAGGAMFPFLDTMAAQANGMALGRGGASNMIDAMTGLLAASGGQIRTGVDVERIEVSSGRAVAVHADGGRFVATRAVIANLVPSVLFGRLVDTSHLPGDFAGKVARYRHAPGTMMLHLAMSDLPAWAAGEKVSAHAYVHIAPYLDDMARTYQQAMAGLLPDSPTLVVGQPTAVDPTRAPAGSHVLWVQVRMVPARIGGDAGRSIDATDWSEAGEPMADRVMSILERYAPGIRDRVLGRSVMTPDDLEAVNPNLVGGDQLGGSHHLMQHFLLRPVPGWSRYATPIESLYLCGAASWPGAGVGAGSGHLLGKLLTRRRLPWSR